MLNIALKEWAIICDLLLEGRLALLLRKGGIREANGPGEFELEQPRFLLFPSWMHQRPEMIEPGVPWAGEGAVGQEPPRRSPSGGLGEVTKIWRRCRIACSTGSRWAALLDARTDRHAIQLPAGEPAVSHGGAVPHGCGRRRRWKPTQRHTPAVRAGCRWDLRDGVDDAGVQGYWPTRHWRRWFVRSMKRSHAGRSTLRWISHAAAATINPFQTSRALGSARRAAVADMQHVDRIRPDGEENPIGSVSAVSVEQLPYLLTERRTLLVPAHIAGAAFQGLRGRQRYC